MLTAAAVDAGAARANKILVIEPGYIRTAVRSYVPPVLAHELATDIDAHRFADKQSLMAGVYMIDLANPCIVLQHL